MLINEMTAGSGADGVYLVKRFEVRQSKNGKGYLDLTLADVSGTVPAKLWDISGVNTASLRDEVFLSVKASAETYAGALQLRVEKVEAAKPGEERLKELIATAPFPAEKMYARIMDLFDRMGNAQLKRLCTEIYTFHMESLLHYPAAKNYHHSTRAGLLHHVYSMLKAAASLLEVYPFLDRDLLNAGIALHDVGKITEMSADPVGAVTSYTAEGNLIGHITIGILEIDRWCSRLGVDAHTAMLLEHMILSHHGVPEYGSPKEPMFAEAEMLHHLDVLDARMNQFEGAGRNLPAGEFQRAFALDNRTVYNHGALGSLPAAAEGTES